MRPAADLFLTFARIGLFTFGGGYAMIALIEHACVKRKQWITHDEMMDITVIAESTPGPIAINCATYVGYKQKGLPGAAAATAGIVLPSFCVIYLLSLFLDCLPEVGWIAGALAGIRAAAAILILDAAVRMIRKMRKKPFPAAVTACAFAAMLLIDLFALKVSTVILMLAAAAISLAVCVMKRHAGKEGAAE